MKKMEMPFKDIVYKMSGRLDFNRSDKITTYFLLPLVILEFIGLSFFKSPNPITWYNSITRQTQVEEYKSHITINNPNAFRNNAHKIENPINLHKNSQISLVDSLLNLSVEELTKISPENFKNITDDDWKKIFESDSTQSNK